MNNNFIKDNDRVSPLISVIIPVYNVEKYLARCVESILKQNYKYLEIILVDDGSLDNSVEICKYYAKIDSRIKLFTQNNQGSSVARNTGLSYAEGEYISFIDSDDWIQPEMLEMMLGFAIKNNLEVLECESTKSTNLKNKCSKVENNTFVIIETNEEALARIIKYQKFAVWRRIYRKETIGNLRFIPYKLHQDVFFTLDILKKINKHGYIKIPFYNYNVENISIIRSPYSQKKLDAIDATFYVINQTKVCSDNVKKNAKTHVIQQLTYHYNELYFHSYLDKDYKIRRLIKCEISNILSFQNWSIYGILIKYLPYSLYGYFIRLNRYRIASQVYLMKLLR